jgi:hypothetical protein
MQALGYGFPKRLLPDNQVNRGSTPLSLLYELKPSGINRDKRLLTTGTNAY